MEKHDNPMKLVVEAVRNTILKAHKRIPEVIKWQAPPFTYKDNRASFNSWSKSHASLLFHTGASIKGNFPSFGRGRKGQVRRTERVY